MKFSNVLAWIKHILHLDHHGVLPPAPTNGESATLPAVPPAPVPAPAPTPAPVPAPATQPPATGGPLPPTQLPAGILAIDDRGFYKVAAAEAARASDADLALMPTWWNFEPPTGLTATFISRSNLTQAKELIDLGSVDLTNFNATHCEQARAMTPNAQGFGYTPGLQYDDTLTFIGDNVDPSTGKVFYRGLRVDDFPQFLTNCKAAYAAAVARGEDQIRARGNLPIIDHSRSAPVAS